MQCEEIFILSPASPGFYLYLLPQQAGSYAYFVAHFFPSTLCQPCAGTSAHGWYATPTPPVLG